MGPIQEWFFAGEDVDVHHFNQSVLLNFPSGLSSGQATQIFSKLQEHHDALRMVYQRTASGFIQENKSTGTAVWLEEDDLLGSLDPAGDLLLKSSLIQSGIDLGSGPLLRLGLFHMVGGSRLLMVAHHLVIDAVSWRILLEDIDTLYRQAVSGQALLLPAKTDSYRSWTSGLRSYIESASFKHAMRYWSGLGKDVSLPVPRDNASGDNRSGETATVSFELSRESTTILLTGVHKPFNTQINDLLLTGLTLGLQACYGLTSQQVDLEGHGREELPGGLDISRTVGWFTSLHPVLLETKTGGALATLKHIKESLRAIPNKGLDYLISRYVGGNPLGLQGWGTGSRISFNYLGQFDADSSGTVYELAYEQTGATISGARTRSHDWEISGMIVQGQVKDDADL